MPLDDVLNITPVNQANGTGALDALVIEEYTGMVEGTIERRSVLQPMIPMRSIRGTDTFTNRAVGKSTLQKVTAGAQLDGTVSQFAKNAVTVDTVVAAREAFALLDVFLTNIDVRRETAMEQGKEIAKFTDQALMIQAIKAALLTNSSYAGGVAGTPTGHFGGNQEVLGAAGDVADPARLYAALARLMVKFENKDVDPRNDDLMIVVKPAEYYTLIAAEQLINTNYVSANGNSIQDAWVLKTYGVPVFSSNNLPAGLNITGHLLSNAGNSNAYDGDFTDVVAAAFSPRAIMAGEAIPLESDIFYDKLHKSWFVDSHLSFAVGPNRAEYAGVILLA